MKKILIVLLIFCSGKVLAQNTAPINSAFSIAAELPLPSNSAYSIGVGISGKYELPIVAPVNLTFTGGFTAMFYKSNLFNSSLTPGAAGFIPLKVGLRYFFNSGFNLEGEAGTVMGTNYGKQKSFVLAIGPSFVIPLNHNKRSIDIGFRYENWTQQFHQTGIRIAYRFGL